MRAIYAFSGDPITNGHIDIVARAARTYDHVTVAIGDNPRKSGLYLFNRDERLQMIRHSLRHIPNVAVTAFDGLLAEYAYRSGFDVIVRGVRNNTDLEGELVLFAVNESLHPTLDTVFFPARGSLAHIASSVVKAIVAEGGDVSDYCPLHVKEALERRIRSRFMVAVAGGIAAGKTWVARELAERLALHVPATYISLDEVGHYVLGPSEAPIYRTTRQRVAERFGADVIQKDGSVDRRLLGRRVFSDRQDLNDLDAIMREPMLTRLYEETSAVSKGIIVLEGAIIVEAGWTNLVSNNVVLVDAPDDLRLARLIERNQLPKDEAQGKIDRQLPQQRRLDLLNQAVAERTWGRIWQLSSPPSDEELDRVTQEIVAAADLPPNGE
jgi:pantetheine-phosphate adenylyltransferase